jgi:hypothetical protein
VIGVACEPPRTVLNSTDAQGKPEAPSSGADLTTAAPQAARGNGSQADPVAARQSDFPVPRSLTIEEEVEWNLDEPQAENFARIGQHLAESGDIYRRSEYAGGLLLGSRAGNVPPTEIRTASQLAADGKSEAVAANKSPLLNHVASIPHGEIEEHGHRRIADRDVVPGKCEAAGLAIDLEDGDVVAALVAAVEKPARGVEVEAPRVVPSCPLLPEEREVAVWPNRKDPDAVVQPVARINESPIA